MQSILMNHDAGKYWSKNSLIIKPGFICIETLSLEYSSDMDEIKQRIINHFKLKKLFYFHGAGFGCDDVLD